MYDTAIDVLERLQQENDQVVDLWYLGGWCLYLYGEKMMTEEEQAQATKEIAATVNGVEVEKGAWKGMWMSARDWLQTCGQVRTVCRV